MIEEHAVIIGMEQDQAVLEVVRRVPCGLCGKTRGCGISLWGGLLGHRAKALRATNAIGAKMGDQVIIGVDERALLSSSLLVYGIPGALLLTGAAIGSAIPNTTTASDGWAAVGAVAGLLLGILWVRLHLGARNLDPRYQPVILRSANAQPCFIHPKEE